jgi:hypothetical protein
VFTGQRAANTATAENEQMNRPPAPNGCRVSAEAQGGGKELNPDKTDNETTGGEKEQTTTQAWPAQRALVSR